MGALIVGGLLLTVLAVALLSSIVAKRQLDEAAQAQVAITVAQQRLDDLLRTQLDEEAALREAIAARAAGDDPYAGMDDPFVPLLGRLTAELEDAGFTQARAATAGIAETHARWQRDVAAPLRAGVSVAQDDRLEAYSKVLVDQLQTQMLDLRSTLQAHMKDVQDELTVKINQTVEFSVGFVVLFAVAAVLLTVRTSLARERFEQEHSIVETFEDALRVGWDPFPRAAVGTRYLSATTQAQVGGDLIDMWCIDEERGFVLIADVSGKGIEAAVNTAFVKYGLRTLAADEDDPAVILARFNDLFIETIDNPQLFVEVFLGLFDVPTGRLRYASGGHACAYLRRGRNVEMLPTTGPLIGIDPAAVFTHRDVVLDGGDLLVLTTDGLTEARDANGAIFGDDAAIDLIATGPQEPQALCDRIVECVSARGGGRITDDLALLAVAPAGAQASLRIG